MLTITEPISQMFILGACIIGLLFGFLNAYLILRVKVISIEEEVMAIKGDNKHLKY